MASARIEVSGTATPLNGALRTLVNTLWQARHRAKELKEIMDQSALGGDYEGLGLALGISAADAQAVYALVGSVRDELEGSAAAPDAGVFLRQLCARCG
jgi:hypothetical protein